ncbi:MarR family winged helix-turn-helix transcriptional regulator [Parasphingopyxis lamellibrachiae]|uniref:MarR family transcriptional regulator n=1 Tax=Parasphingopyxis lamellibrachiae TaxID=680125 RepID=A0A3D9FGJ5_9SPHN|nr:MarR family transcriptional regulator [Parasphingopyxis lamellibrachiae]RED16909.1 MarR family transcriptional regulator [Parasphingopyxis lamellibrachiae]
MSKGRTRKAKGPGLRGDPPIMLAITEIAIIAQLAETLFESVLPEGMTKAQYGVLNHLLRLDAEQTIGELASAFQVRQPTMSSTVRKLEDKGLVALEADPDDRRIRRVAVTKAGRAMRRTGLDGLAPLNEVLTGEISARELKAILPTLTKLRILLDDHRPE